MFRPHRSKPRWRAPPIERRALRLAVAGLVIWLIIGMAAGWWWLLP